MRYTFTPLSALESLLTALCLTRPVLADCQRLTVNLPTAGGGAGQGAASLPWMLSVLRNLSAHHRRIGCDPPFQLPTFFSSPPDFRSSPPARPFSLRSINNEPLAPPAVVGVASGRGMLGRETLSRLLIVDFELKFAARNYTP